ncbi:unnamed protein product [Strongylus vulgaris]|uniref:Cytochrome P450 n=1 Tax=Strongylus vulgaris TaxID=40348 RepID=A0A3P7I7D9_STRVU|nr:unnamed protein product [Strongylus vulgaris]
MVWYDANGTYHKLGNRTGCYDQAWSRDRWVPMLLDYLRNGMGVIMSNGKVWMDHRRFTLQTLRDFGFGKNIMEEKIMEEFNLKFEEVDAEIQRSGSSIVDPFQVIDVLIGSIISRILYSERLDSVYLTDYSRPMGVS